MAKTPRNLRNLWLMNYLCAYRAPYKALYCCRALSIIIEDSLQISPFMQNKPNFQKAQMNVSPVVTREYKNISNWTLSENKPNTNPIKPNFHGGLNERELLCRKRVMEMILKTAKFGIIMMPALAMCLTGRTARLDQDRVACGLSRGIVDCRSSNCRPI